jgi:Zn-dependent protease/CBS domain-containing protein
MPGSLRIGKIAGISIEVHASWLIIFALLTYSLATGWFVPARVPQISVAQAYLFGAVGALLLFASVVAHELAHALVAQARGLPVKSITLFVFGGVSNLEREPRSAGVEFQMALVGPLTSLAIGALFWPLGNLVDPISPALGALLVYVGFTNFLLGAFNLIPGFPLDGGRILRSTIWQATGSVSAATRWAAGVGQGIAYLFIMGGLWLLFAGYVVDGLWIGLVGWFLLTAAQAEVSHAQLEAMFRGVTVGQVMTPAPASAPPDISMRELVDEYMLPHGQRLVPVIQQGQLVGLVTLREIQRVPREQWADTLVSRAMVPRAALHVAAPAQPIADVLPVLVDQNINQLPVVENGRLVGILSRDAILRMLEVRRSLGATRRTVTRAPDRSRPDTVAPHEPPLPTPA